jgi:hypothetical protein
VKWKQEELKKRGLRDKEIANLALDRCKNKDPDTLKVLGGPFTSSNEVDDYLNSDVLEAEKLSRLYTEVRYSQDPCLLLPKNGGIFHLMSLSSRPLFLSSSCFHFSEAGAHQ